MSDTYLTFQRIHPFGDGNGRTGRLLLVYIAAYMGMPVPIVPSAEKSAFFEAHSAKNPMRIFIANQVLKSTLFMGTIYERVDDTDEYRAPSGQVVICKTNAIQKAITDWMTSESECGK